MTQPLVSMVPQRHLADCVAAVTSMFLRVSYEEALLALSKESPELIRKGVWFTELQRAARQMGVPLKLKRRWDVNFHDGIVHVRFARGGNHVVLLRAGLFWDTNFEAWYPEDYLKAKKAKVGSMLIRDGG